MSERAAHEWQRRAAAEMRSAGLAAELAARAIRIGLPQLASPLFRAAEDELQHASDASLVAAELGAGGIVLDVEDLSFAREPGGPLDDLFVPALQSLAIGETLAVPLFRAMATAATEPLAKRALNRIVSDEARHAALGWRVVDAVAARDPEGAANVAKRRLPGLLGPFQIGFGEAKGPDLEAADRAWGLLDAAAYRTIWRRTWLRTLAPRLARRGWWGPRDVPGL